VNCQLTLHHIERFRAAISRQIGLRFDQGRHGFLNDILRRRLTERGCSQDAYLWELEREPSKDEYALLAQELTVGETYFFRNNEQFRALADVVIPQRIRAARPRKVLRLLSAGCSSGEEAYSMAITVNEVVADPSWTVAIRGVDLNPVALEKASRARYSAWALRETPTNLRTTWFHMDGREMVLDDAVRSAVTFAAANLASEDSDLWPVARYDVIFCRNVLMYFDPEQMSAVIERIARALMPGGFLFLGHAETLRGVSDRFILCHTHETFYYQLGEGADADTGRVVRILPNAFPTAPSRPGQDVAWVDAIRIASERVATLVPLPDAIGGAVQPRPIPFDVAPALELLRQEKFTEALNLIRLGLQASARDRDVLLLEAILLVLSGQLEAADEAASRLLLIDEQSSGAHYVLALCREHAGLCERAAEHHRAAAALEPTFAMPRLHLGLLARRVGDHETARREFDRALALLEREEQGRLLLYGGGFNRETLMGLCQSASTECGGRA
jgi:chemotaxis protein methyltransferase CheR